MAEGPPSLSPYVEGQVSHLQVNDADGTTSISAGGFNSVINGDIEYDADIAFGAEIGIRKIANTGFRIAASFTKFQAELEQLNVSGQLSFNGNVIAAGSGTFSRDQVEAAGVSFDNDVKAYSINGYYDFKGNDKVIPYIGVGAGLADIENANDNELMLSGYAGVNYMLTEKLYAGGRASYHWVSGPDDSIGISYDDITVYSVGVVMGYNF